MPNDVVTVERPLTKAAARKLTNEILSTGERLWALLLEAQRREAWRALGYASWREYAAAEFDMSQSHAYRLVNQGHVLEALEAAGADPIDLPESHARALTPLVNDPNALADAYVEAVEAGDGKATAATVKDAVDRRVPPKDTPAKKPKAHDPADDFDGTPPDEEPVPTKSNAADAIIVFTRIADDLVDAIATERWARVDQMVRPDLRRVVEAMNRRQALEKGDKPAKATPTKKAAAKPAAKKVAAKATPTKKAASGGRSTEVNSRFKTGKS